MSHEKLYSCTTCKGLFPLTEKNFYKNLIIQCEKNPNKSSAGKCIPCAQEYSTKYREGLKQKGLTRRNTVPIEKCKNGTLYIIGTTPNNPVKIGITSGANVTKRLTGLQTSHWLDLKVIYKTKPVKDVNILERTLHKAYKKYHVRGEWFMIPQEKIKKLIEGLEKKI
jgi:hypothetical protein